MLRAGMSVRTASARVVANLGWGRVRATAPVFAGDTLYAGSAVLSKHESRSRPGQGILTISTCGLNPRVVPVMSFDLAMLVYRRGDAPDEAANC